MLTAHRISKSYGIQPILKDISFSINSGERVGLIGPNGCGKSTLLKILLGIETADSGYVTYSIPNLQIGYLSQGFETDDSQLFGEFVKNAVDDPEVLEKQVMDLAEQISQNPDQTEIYEAYDQLLLQLQEASSNNQLEEILASFGLDQIPIDQPVQTLSGGQKTRLSLALALLKKPQLLLLDEPTNHLDIAMLEWLEAWLSSFRGGVLIVSHDRTFLDRTTNKILDLDPETQTVKSYPGNYSDYLEAYQQQIEKQWSEYKDQQAEIRRIKQDIARTKEQSRNVEITTTSRQPTVRRYAKKVAKKALSREKKLERYLNSDEIVDKPKEHWQMKLDFGKPYSSSKNIVRLINTAIGFDPEKPLLQHLNLSIRAEDRIVLTGKNGSGKTTLLRTIMDHIQPLSGSIHIGETIHIGYMDQEQTSLDPEKSAVEIIQNATPMNETDARSFLHYFLFSGDEALKPTKHLSYGERARLSLASLVIQGCTLLLLDEPINHLDIPSRERFEQALFNYDGAVLAVVHDRYFIERFATHMWITKSDSIKQEVLVSDIED